MYRRLKERGGSETLQIAGVGERNTDSISFLKKTANNSRVPERLAMNELPTERFLKQRLPLNVTKPLMKCGVGGREGRDVT